ncbi:MAG TPA: patatin-like phospholipase family protein [Jiangellales bacterium]|nr:patatin-like phospholipase family protein [Jiangellales bacterium]
MASDLAGALPRPIGLVLGGGASFGAVQVGMVRALDETGLRPDLVVGTSVGSLNGAIIAADPVGAGNRLRLLWAGVRRRTVFPGGWLARARTLQASHAWLSDSSGISGLVRQSLHVERFDQLRLPFAAVATDVLTGRPVVLRDGAIEPAVLASAAIPAVLPPVEIEGRRLVDGGLVANVPVIQALDLGAASLVVLDCGVLGLRTEAPRTLVESMLHTAAIVVRQQVVRDVPAAAAQVPVVYLPGPFPMTTSPLDFRHTARLSGESYELSRRFLADVRPDGPGLYGAPPLLASG